MTNSKIHFLKRILSCKVFHWKHIFFKRSKCMWLHSKIALLSATVRTTKYTLGRHCANEYKFILFFPFISWKQLHVSENGSKGLNPAMVDLHSRVFILLLPYVICKSFGKLIYSGWKMWIG